VRNVPYGQATVAAVARRIWNGGRPRRGSGRNPYAALHTGLKIAHILARTRLDQSFLRKLISY
jgi:hypothetical protein